MKNKRKEGRLHQLDTRPVIILSAVCFMLLILVTLIASLMNQTNASGKTPDSGKTSLTEEPELSAAPVSPSDKYKERILAVIAGVDTEQNRITLIHTETDEVLSLEYSGGSDIRDKYDRVISGAQLTPGDLADVTYQGVTRQLVSLSVNTKGWECSAVSGLLVDSEKNRLSFLGNRYSYTDGLLILNNGKKIQLSELLQSDVLIIRGYQEKICSITVTRGHGYLKLSEDKDFIGGTIEVGLLLSEQIREGMVLTVPEGTYEVKISNGKYSGTEKITVKRDEISVLRADAYGPTGIQTGRVTFQIQPENAVLYIDGKETFFALPVELTYGEHEIKAELGGYNSYQGTIRVDRTDSKFRIILSENSGSVDGETSGGTGEWEEPGDGDGSSGDGNPGNGENGTGNGDSQNGDWPDDDWPDENPDSGQVPPDDDDFNSEPEPGDGDSGEEDNSGGGGEDNSEDGSGGNHSGDGDGEGNSEDGSGDDNSGDGSGTGSDNTSESGGIDSSHTLTIRCTSGARVYIGGAYVGEIKNGEIVLPKYLGQLDISLTLGSEVKRYTLEVVNDNNNTVFTFPGF